MNTAYLKTFIEVINMKNISKAAEKLYITQPAVSKQLQILENDFDAVLLKKDGRDILPTEAGRELYKFAINMLSEENRVYSILKKKESSLVGELNIYASSMPTSYFLHNIIADFSKLYPLVSYNVKKLDSKVVYSCIEEGSINYGFTGALYKSSKIDYVSIAEDDLVVAASADKFAEYKNQSVDIDFLLKNDFIIRENGSATLKTFENFLVEKGYSLKNLHVRVTAEDSELIKKLIIDNMGISIISKLSIEKEVEQGLIVPINIKDADLKRNIYFIYHSDRYFSRPEEMFKNFIIERFS